MRFSYKEQKEFDEIDGVIAKLEQDIKQVDKQMSESSSNFELLQKLIEEKEQLEKKLDDAIERWTYLSERAEEIEKSKKGE